MTTRTELFAAYGDDARAALDAWSNLDPEAHAFWSTGCEERQYRAEHRRWLSRQTTAVVREVKAKVAGSAPLFELEQSDPPKIDVRRVLIHDGHPIDMLTLAGEDGARILREAMLRDLGPANTTRERCQHGLALAEQVIARSEAEGRPVSVAEVLGLAVAS